VIFQQPKVADVLFADRLTTTTVIGWSWWERPLAALKLLLGGELVVTVQTETEHHIGHTRAAATHNNLYVPWWPRPAGYGEVSSPGDDR
jgi:hypothetical protein